MKKLGSFQMFCNTSASEGSDVNKSTALFERRDAGKLANALIVFLRKHPCVDSLKVKQQAGMNMELIEAASTFCL